MLTIEFDLANLITIYLFDKVGVADFLWLTHPAKIIKHRQ